MGDTGSVVVEGSVVVLGACLLKGSVVVECSKVVLGAALLGGD